MTQTPPTRRLALSARRLSKSYRMGTETIRALQDLSLEVQEGEFLAVMGPSGSGKSTLLHLLGLLDAPDEGEVTIGTQSTHRLDDDALTCLRRERLGFIFQSFELIPNLSAQENILLPAEVAGRRREALAGLPELADALGIRERLTHRPSQLSGGQQQRVAIARALINNPVVILADEPTGNLDSQTGADVLGLLQKGVRTRGWTVVMVTHDPKAALYADRILFLRDGRVAGETRSSDGNVREVIEQYVGI